MKSNKETIIERVTQMFAENTKQELNEDLGRGIEKVFKLLEQKDGWIQSPRQNRTKIYWLICETKNGEILKEKDGVMSFGMLIDTREVFAKELIDIMFEIKRNGQDAYGSLMDSPALCA